MLALVQGSAMSVLMSLMFSGFPSLASGACSSAIILAGRRRKPFPAELRHPVDIPSWERSKEKAGSGTGHSVSATSCFSASLCQTISCEELFFFSSCISNILGGAGKGVLCAY